MEECGNQGCCGKHHRESRSRAGHYPARKGGECPADKRAALGHHPFEHRRCGHRHRYRRQDHLHEPRGGNFNRVGSCGSLGQPLSTVFKIINEQTRQPAENPVDKVLRLGTVVGLANHTVLIAKDGREISHRRQRCASTGRERQDTTGWCSSFETSPSAERPRKEQTISPLSPS